MSLVITAACFMPPKPLKLCILMLSLNVTYWLFPAKGRTNFDLREQLALDDTSQTFTPRRSSTGRISPFPSSTMKRRQNDTGYASSNSSGTSLVFTEGHKSPTYMTSLPPTDHHDHTSMKHKMILWGPSDLWATLTIIMMTKKKLL